MVRAADAESYIAHVASRPVQTTFAIVVEDTAIGSISLMLGDDIAQRSAEVGYWIGREFLGRGIMVDAVRATKRYAFDALGLVRVFALPFATTARSARVLEKAGYGGLPALTLGGMPGVLAIAAGAGAFVGIIGAPLLGWGLLRAVPLGRVILITALGTIGGAVLGEWARFLNPYATIIPSVIAGAFVGFLLSGVALRIHARRT